jgi:hypothetical protein
LNQLTIGRLVCFSHRPHTWHSTAFHWKKRRQHQVLYILNHLPSKNPLVVAIFFPV